MTVRHVAATFPAWRFRSLGTLTGSPYMSNSHSNTPAYALAKQILESHDVISANDTVYVIARDGSWRVEIDDDNFKSHLRDLASGASQRPGATPADVEEVLERVRSGARHPIVCQLAHQTSDGTLLFDRFDDSVSVADGNAHRVVANGSFGVWFRRPPDSLPVPTPAESQLTTYFGNVIGGFRFTPRCPGLTPSGLSVLIMTWLFAAKFKPLIRTRPLLLAVGAPGSGKDTLLRFLGQLLIGPDFGPIDIGTVDQRSVATSIARRPLIHLDNLDDPRARISPDLVARMSTGGTLTGRRNYKDPDAPDAEYRVPIDCFTMLSSFSGGSGFLRSDVADRSLIVRLAPPQGGVLPEQAFRELSIQCRPQFEHDAMRVATEVVRRLKNGSAPMRHVASRLSEFYWLGGLITECYGADAKREFEAAMLAMEGERILAVGATDPLAGLLVAWMLAGGEGVEVTATELFEGLARASGAQSVAVGVNGGFAGTLRSATSLGRQLGDLTRRVQGQIQVSDRTLNGCVRHIFRFTPRVRTALGLEAVHE